MPRTFFKNWLSRLFTRRPMRLESHGKRRPGRTPMRFEQLEDRLAPALAMPTVALSVPQEVLIGEVAHLSVTFDNTGSATGFGPYVDLFLPATGFGGNNIGANSPNDGITFVPNSATLLGAPVVSSVSPLANSGLTQHPFAKYSTGNLFQIPTPSGFFAGDQMVRLELPFGSFTPNQPVMTVSFDVMVSNRADVNQPLPILACGGFRYGLDALDNPGSDPTISPFNDGTAALDVAANSGAGTCDDTTATPVLFTLTKRYLGPEDETATGPNFAHQYQIIVNVANGQTINNLTITDTLANNMQYISLDSVTGTSGAIAINTNPLNFPSVFIPGGQLIVEALPPVVGTLSSSDVDVKFSFYIPQLAANGLPVIDPITGDAVISTDDVKVEGNWTPLDPLDPSQHVVSDLQLVDHTLTDRSIAVQKSVFDVTTGTGVLDHHHLVNSAPSQHAGDTLRYTINFQISDFFAFEDVFLADVISDGQEFLYNPGDPSTLPTFTFTRGGITTSTSTNTFIGPNIQVVGPDATTGITNVQFDLSAELASRGFLGAGSMFGAGVDGSCMPQTLAGPGTTGTVTFYTKIREDFFGTDHQPIAPALQDQSVDAGDTLTNGVTISGKLCSTNPMAPAKFETDTSGTVMVLPNGVLTKSIYAVRRNGFLNFASGPVSVAANDEVTYRLQYYLPASDSDRLILEDYLPMPIFTFPPMTFLSPTPLAAGSVPVPGQAAFGSADTSNLVFPGKKPTMPLPNALNNSIRFEFDYQTNPTLGSFDDPLETPALIDILFTVTVSAASFADGLRLTNLAHSEERTTNGDVVAQNAIVQLTLTEPVLNIIKGVVATDNSNGQFSTQLSPGALPAGGIKVTAAGSAGWRFQVPGTSAPALVNSANINAPVFINTADAASAPYSPYTLNSNLSNVDAVDFVTFVIVIHNVGTGLNGAFNVSFTDTIPSGFHVPTTGLNLFIADGTGAPFSFGGPNPAMIATTIMPNSFSISIFDPGPTTLVPGAIDPFHPTSGRDLLVMTYDLQINKNPGNNAFPAVNPADVLTNTATLRNYTSTPNNAPGLNFVPNGLTDAATVTIAPLVLSKRLVKTEIINGPNGAMQAVIGERVQYAVTLTVPEGIANSVMIRDILGPGMAYVKSSASLNLSPPLVPDTFGTKSLALALTPPLVLFPTLQVSAVTLNSADGTVVTFNLGKITNSDINNSIPETITITYWAQVLNVVTNQDVMSPPLTNRAQAIWTNHMGQTAGPIVSAPPLIIIEPKLTVSKLANPNHVDANGVTTFVVSVTNTTGSSAAAYDVTLSDLIPAGFTYVAGSLVQIVSGILIAPTSLAKVGNTIKATWASMPLGKGGAFSFRATLSPKVAPCTDIVNYGTAMWTSLPGNPGQRLNYNVNSRERTGADGVGGALNDYAHTGMAVAHVNGSDLCGVIYCDANNNGVMDTGEDGIGGVIMKLTGFDHLGNFVNLTVATDANGNYCFQCLRPTDPKRGGYTITEVQPAGYLEGQDQAPTPFGGNVSVQNVISNIMIPLGSNAHVTGYNFGEVHPPSICGFVYLDVTQNGVKDPGEAVIPGVNVYLSGVNDLGQPVNLGPIQTGPDGSYSFTGLRPSNASGYTITETQPALYADGLETAGTAGGVAGAPGTDIISRIVVSWCQEATGYNFGEECMPPVTPPAIPDCPVLPRIPMSVVNCPDTPTIPVPLPAAYDFFMDQAGDVIVYTKPGAASVTITDDVGGAVRVNINGSNFGNPTPTHTLYIDTTYSGSAVININLTQTYNFNIVVHTGGSDDIVTINGSKPGAPPGTVTGFVCVDTGDGNDTVSIEGITINGSTAVHGGQGMDTVSIGTSIAVVINGAVMTKDVNDFTLGNSAVVNGSLIMDNGSDSSSPNSVTLSPGCTVGNVYYKGGSGITIDDVVLAGTISGDVVLDVGNGSNSLTLEAISIARGLFYVGGADVDGVTFTGPASIAGDVDLHMGDGSNFYHLGTGTEFEVRGDMCIEAGSGRDTFAGGFTGSVLGDLIVKLGDGTNQFALESPGSVAGTLYYLGDAAVDHVAINHGASVDVNVQLGGNNDDFTLGSTSTISGWVDGGAGTDVNFISGTLGSVSFLNIP